MLPRMQMLPFDAHAPWLNTTHPLDTDQLHGQVIILHFWAYGHATSQRSIDDLRLLIKMFKASPFLVIGVHTPKFDAEKDPDNLRHALMRDAIKHPVVCDNDKKLWHGYGIRSRPSFVIIDSKGTVRGRTFGDPAFKSLHKATLQLLDEARHNAKPCPRLKLETAGHSAKQDLYFPTKIAFRGDKNMLAISEAGRNRVLLCQLAQNKASVKTVINEDNDGSLRQPQGLAFYKDNLLIADSANHQIKKFALATKALSGLYTTTANNLLQSYRQQTDPQDIILPNDITIHDDKLYIAGSGNHQIWQFDFKNEKLSHFAGSGWEGLLDGRRENAQLAQPSSLVIKDALLYFCDSQSSAIRQISLTSGLVRTLIGEGLNDWGARDGDFGQARLQHPQHLCFVGSRLVVSDSFNNSLRILELKTRRVSTLVLKAQTKDDSPLHQPDGIVALDQDTCLLANSYHHQILRVNIVQGTIDKIKLDLR